MKKLLVAALFLALAVGVFAKPWRAPGAELNDELTAILNDSASTQLGTMTVADLEKMAGQVSVALQKRAYVQRSWMASMVFPGAGQFRNGDALGGSLFATASVAVFAGTLAGAYFLLPANVQFGYGNGSGAGGLDYLYTPLTGIESSWKQNNLVAYLPSLGVLVGGGIVNGIIRLWSAGNAASEARQNIADGKITFQPTLIPPFGPGWGPGGHGGMGLMMGWRY